MKERLVKAGKADDLYRGSLQFENHRRTALQYPFVHWTLCRCQQYGASSMKALARYQVILLGEQRHIRCEQLAQGCFPNNAAVGVEPATSWSRVQRPTTTPPSHTVAIWVHMATVDVKGLMSSVCRDDYQGVSIADRSET